jgi:hypothetical protein
MSKKNSNDTIGNRSRDLPQIKSVRTVHVPNNIELAISLWKDMHCSRFGICAATAITSSNTRVFSKYQSLLAELKDPIKINDRLITYNMLQSFVFMCIRMLLWFSFDVTSLRSYTFFIFQQKYRSGNCRLLNAKPYNLVWRNGVDS